MSISDGKTCVIVKAQKRAAFELLIRNQPAANLFYCAPP